jgi:hypothetical protein
MKPETQVKIGRATAFVLIFILLTGPPLFLYNKITTGEQELTLQTAVLYLGITYLIMIPLILLCSIFAWALKRKRLKLSLVLFVIHILWAIVSGVLSGLGVVMIIEIIIVLLLLQGILGLVKLREVSPQE